MEIETWTGPYSYLEMTFEEQNKVKLWRKPTGEPERFSECDPLYGQRMDSADMGEC